jgi:tetratricopeptide (TPR) repeat protein
LSNGSALQLGVVMKIKFVNAHIVALLSATLSVGCANSTSVRKSPAEKSVSADGSGTESVIGERLGVLLAQGDIAVRDGRVDQAFHFYLTAERLDPGDDRALVRAGNLHRMLGNRETAEKAWALALTRNPGNAATHESLGFLQLESGRAGAALVSFESALQIVPDSPRASIGLGLACEKQLDFARALRIYETALTTDASSVELRTYRARALMGLGRFAEAKATVAAIVTEPLPVTWIVRGDLFAVDGEYPAALGAYLQTLAEPWAYQRLGEHALRRKEYERALRYFRQAADASPNFFEDADRGMAVAREHLYAGQDSR